MHGSLSGFGKETERRWCADFLLLEASWLRLLLAYVLVYVFVWLLNVGFSVIASGGISNPDDENSFYVAAWTALSNIVAIG